MRQFGFGTDTGHRPARSSSTGGCRRTSSKAQLSTTGCSAAGETANLQPGDLLQMAIGQGLMAATRCSSPSATPPSPTAATCSRPMSCSAVLAPGTPDGEPGFVDLARAERDLRDGARGDGRSRWATELARADHRGRPPERHRPRRQRPLDDRRGAVRHRLPEPQAIPIGGKTGTAQGCRSYPWNDSSAFAAFSLDPARPYTVVSYLEKAGYGSRRGAGGQVHVPRPVRRDAARPGRHLRAARPRQRRAGGRRCPTSTPACMARAPTPTRCDRSGGD